MSVEKLNLNVIVVLIIIIALVLTPGLIALGITPGRTTINYEKGLEKEVSFSVMNNEHKNMQVFLTVQGELNETIALSNALIDFLPSEESKQFSYKIKLPDKLLKEPGLHTAEIVALEVPKANSEGSFVGATVAVVSQVHVYVPCPGKCIDSDMNVLDSEQNSTATFIIPVVSRGNLGIGNLRAEIEIYTSMNAKVATIETDTQTLESGKRTELSAKWPVNVNSGDYLAKITVFYDGESKSFEKPFTVGIQNIDIQSIMVNNFQLGEIAKLQILVENKWNQELSGVYANLLVYDDNDQVMADVKSSPEIISPLSKKELIAYWDTVGVSEGEYSGKLMVKYGQKSTDKDLVLKVSESNLDVFGVGYAIQPKGTKGVNVTFILIVLVVLLLLVNLAWFIFFKRMMANQNKNQIKIKKK